MEGLKPGIIIQLPELVPSSQYYKKLQSIRTIGSMESYSTRTKMAVISHGEARFRVDTQFLLSRLELRTGCLYQFIGELVPDPDASDDCQLMLQARVGRNVDGLDLGLYDRALQIRRQFEQKYLAGPSTLPSGVSPES